MYDLVAGGKGVGAISHYVSPRQSLAAFPTLAARRQDGASLKGTVGRPGLVHVLAVGPPY